MEIVNTASSLMEIYKAVKTVGVAVFVSGENEMNGVHPLSLATCSSLQVNAFDRFVVILLNLLDLQVCIFSSFIDSFYICDLFYLSYQPLFEMGVCFSRLSLVITYLFLLFSD